MSLKAVMTGQALVDILGMLIAEEKMELACRVLDKNRSDYEHLDRGRMAMTGGNMLRNALKKDESLLARVSEEAAAIIRDRDPSLVLQPKKESSKKQEKPSVAGEHVRSQEKNWGLREQPEWVFDEKEMKRLEAVYDEEEKLRAAGKLPPRRLILVATQDTFMYFGGEALPKYQWTAKKPKGRLTIN